MKRFDDIFKQQVKDAFGNYNADHLADAGWKALQQKKGNSRWLGLIIPVWAKAASVAILLSLGGFITYQTLNNQSKFEMAEIASYEIPEITNPIIPNIIVEDISSVKAIPKSSSAKRQVIISVNSKQNSEEIIKINDLITETTPLATIDSAVIETYEKLQNESLALSIKDSVEVVEDSPVIVPKSTLPLAFTEEVDESIRTKKTSFFAGLSGMMARFENMVSSSPGVSVGLYTEHKLTNSISFRPGLALAKHSYDLQSISSGNDYMYASPSLDDFSGEVVSAETHMDMVAMEVPLNFVFKIRENRKRSIFLSAGASTMVYLSQRFTGSYQNVSTREVYDSASGVTSIESSYTNIEVENEYGAFSRVDYFGLANLSAGYAFPFGKGSSMLVEPFIQLPTHDITSSDLRIRFGGLSLKFQFGK